MIDITKLLRDDDSRDSIRYSKKCRDAKHGTMKGRGPVVAWNITKKCNYKCKHCYSSSEILDYENELSFEEIKATVDSLKEMNVPVILLSGGEPLFRSDIFEVIEYIRSVGIKVSLSTNGSLIDESVAVKLKQLGIGYVGISIDGMESINDRFRGVKGAFENSIRAIDNCKKAGVKVGLRFTINKGNHTEIPKVMNLMEEMDISRICFYHLVPSGRGSDISGEMLNKDESRQTLDYLYEYSKESVKSGVDRGILTVTNHTDGPYLYLKAKQDDSQLAEKILEKLSRNGGNRSGIAIANIDSFGNVYPDQFSRFIKLGNIKVESFKDIWTGESDILKKLRNRKQYLNNICKSCRWLDICNGNLRARAWNTSNNLWGMDPGCYLRSEEI